MTRKITNHHKCSHWSEVEQRCTSSCNGLFIPSEDYIATYCTRTKHQECAQYISASKSQASEKAQNVNRRKYPRFTKYHRITLRKINESGNFIQDTFSNADIIDLSKGGMQITTHDPLINDTILNFSFGKSSPPSLQKGFARVKWCHYHKESLSYKAGLAFQTERMVNGTQPDVASFQ